jgi:hypothetical protein
MNNTTHDYNLLTPIKYQQTLHHSRLSFVVMFSVSAPYYCEYLLRGLSWMGLCLVLKYLWYNFCNRFRTWHYPLIPPQIHRPSLYTTYQTYTLTTHHTYSYIHTWSTHLTVQRIHNIHYTLYTTRGYAHITVHTEGCTYTHTEPIKHTQTHISIRKSPCNQAMCNTFALSKQRHHAILYSFCCSLQAVLEGCIFYARGREPRFIWYSALL